MTRASSADIATDLAVAILFGYIRPGGKVPGQHHLRTAYGVAAGTAAGALRKLADAGLAQGDPGRGTYAASEQSMTENPPLILDILAAAFLCRSGTLAPPGIDRHVILWLGTSFYFAARRVMASGPGAADESLLAAVRSVLGDRALPSGRTGEVLCAAGEEAAARIWPKDPAEALA